MLESVSLEPSAAHSSAFDPSDVVLPKDQVRHNDHDDHDDDDDDDDDKAIPIPVTAPAAFDAANKRPSVGAPPAVVATPASAAGGGGGGSSSCPVTAGDSPSVVVAPPVFEVRVFAPQKVGEGMHAYTVYLVAVGDGRPVPRRYSDFKWLHDTLVLDEPLRVVPPVPGKSLTGRFNEQFVAVRCFELNQFMHGVMAHWVLSHHAAVRAFLADDGGAALEAMRASRATASPPASAPAPAAEAPAPANSTTQRLGAIGSALWSAVTSLPAKVAKAATAPPDEIDPYIDAATGRLQALRAALAHAASAARRRASALVSEAGLEPAADGTVAPAVTAQVSGGASDVAAALLGLARSEAGHDARSASTISTVASTAQHQLSLMSQDAAETRTTLAHPADYLARLCDAVGDILSHRLSLLTAAHEAKQRVLTLHSGSHDLESETLAAARRDADAADDAYESATAVVREELENFFQNNSRAMRTVMVEYAQAQMNVAMSSANSWKQVVVSFAD
jgi:hypothetical protein